MFAVVKKLKALKHVLKQLNKSCFSDIENSTSIASTLSEKIQKDLVDRPGDADLIQQEMELSAQKAKVQWSLEGDLNTSYFRHAIKKRNMLNKVFQIEDHRGIVLVRRGICCKEEHWAILARLVTTAEVMQSIFRIPKNKSLRPDGYNTQFYKDGLEVIGDETFASIMNLIIRTQGEFVKGRSILENILICQDLVRFPEHFRRMVMTCVTTTSYSLNLNGSQFGYFQGRRGLRQGDPISPLLFCVCMEYLSRIMEFAVMKWFLRFHSLCKSMGLTHLLFADDLLMFCRGDVRSIMLILRALAIFRAASGLKVNAEKSEEGTLPFKYLGVPVQPGKLSKHDCNILFLKIVVKVRGIGAKKLSYAGRVKDALVKGFQNNQWVAATRECDYSSQIIARVEPWLKLKLAVQLNSCSKVKKKTCRMVKLAYWYHIWHERNRCRLELNLRRPMLIVTEVKKQVQGRLQQLISRRVLSSDRQWLSDLDIPIV
ncbi:uncharacterized protein LOC141628498 [Silene latifolia]|uniref:uncharacterized protein LOC141628498 n=1 Tax=Silene latifolia TaxID=37657 RepID=UPI003D786BEE